MVHGDSTESCLVAIIVPEPDTFVPFVNKVLSGVNLALENVADYKRICSDPKLRQVVLQEVNKAAKDIGLRGYVSFPHCLSYFPIFFFFPFAVHTLEKQRLTRLPPFFLFGVGSRFQRQF